MSLTPYFFNRGFAPSSSFMDPFSSFDDFFDPFALSTPSLSGLTAGGGGGGGLGSAFQHPIHDLENMALAPVMDVRDQGDKYQVLCKPPPNFNQNDLHVRVDRDVLSVSGQHSESEERGTAKRQSRRSFTRLIRLPDSVDQQQIAAKWTNDGLSINLPKKAGALESGRKIQIEGVTGVGGGQSSQMPSSSAAGVSGGASMMGEEGTGAGASKGGSSSGAMQTESGSSMQA